MTLRTDADLADLLSIPREQVVRRARAGEFPHVRIGRRYRFTDDDVKAIIAAHHRETVPVPENPWGVRRRGKAS
jgi:excisionase family DNA binding protein